MPEENKANEAETKTDGQPTELDYDKWLESQPAHVKAAIERNTGKLQSALNSERESRKELTRQLREATGKAEKGSELEKQLGEVSSKAELAEKKAAFYESAGQPEIGCTNPKAAFLIATADDLFKRSGEPDWAAIKAAAPELFAAKKAPNGNAGSGTGNPPPTGVTMDDIIRRHAGRG